MKKTTKIYIAGHNGMVGSAIKLMKKDQYLKDGGYETMNYFE